ncbi:MAG: hypothetical protein OEM41_10820, partial [Ignavibacteria bacterium]|nr:hypothetical protein [Ignavibacteria bacterium]
MPRTCLFLIFLSALILSCFESRADSPEQDLPRQKKKPLNEPDSLQAILPPDSLNQTSVPQLPPSPDTTG